MQRSSINPAWDPAAVSAVDASALAFHRGLPGYAPSPLHDLPEVSAALGVARVAVKDESARLGLPAFKVLGASWAVACELARAPGTRMLVAASAGNHGRAVAHVAARRGLRCRIYLPARVRPARRTAIESEGAEAVVVDGTYEDAVAHALEASRAPGVALVTDVGDAPTAHDVIDGYATLFAELDPSPDVVVVPVGVGSLAAAAARFAAAAGARVLAVEPEAAACLTASLAAGRPVAVATPGTAMAGMDCAEVSPAAWPDLRAGIRAAVTVPDADLPDAEATLAGAGLAPGECSAGALAGLRRAAADPEVAAALDLGPGATIVVLATEGVTSR